MGNDSAEVTRCSTAVVEMSLKTNMYIEYNDKLTWADRHNATVGVHQRQWVMTTFCWTGPVKLHTQTFGSCTNNTNTLLLPKTVCDHYISGMEKVRYINVLINDNDDDDGKRPDGVTLIPWARGKSMARKVTVPDTFAELHLSSTSVHWGAAAKQVADNNQELETTHIFFPVAIETAGSWDHQAMELVQEIRRCITDITEDSRETTFLFQRLSLALQRGNMVSFLGTFPSD